MITLAGVPYDNVFNASGGRNFFGTFDSYWHSRFANWEGSTFQSKTATLESRMDPTNGRGNMLLDPRTLRPVHWKPSCIKMYPFHDVTLNAVGLSNPGLPALLNWCEWQQRTEPILISLAPEEKDPSGIGAELREVVDVFTARKKGFRAPFVIVLNITCPNLHEYNQERAMIAGYAGLEALARLGMPVIVNLNVLMAPHSAAGLIGHGNCAGFCLTNTVPFSLLPQRIDWRGLFGSSVHSPLERYGGLSGPPLLPFVMITEDTTEEIIDSCVAKGIFDAKIYPRWRTTQSEYGVVRYGRILRIVKHCGRVGMRVHFHPEHPNRFFSNRDAEFSFLALALMFLEETDARIFWEHGSDARCIPLWKEMATSGRFFVTITAHHPAANEDNTFGDVGAACKPTIKPEPDRLGLVGFISEDHPWVIAAGDSAYHPEGAKHIRQGRCACGALTAPFLHPLYAHALDHLLQTEAGVNTYCNFTSRNARRILGLPAASRMIRLVRESWQIPLTYQVGTEQARPFWAGQTINWRIQQ